MSESQTHFPRCKGTVLDGCRQLTLRTQTSQKQPCRLKCAFCLPFFPLKTCAADLLCVIQLSQLTGDQQVSGSIRHKAACCKQNRSSRTHTGKPLLSTLCVLIASTGGLCYHAMCLALPFGLLETQSRPSEFPAFPPACRSHGSFVEHFPCLMTDMSALEGAVKVPKVSSMGYHGLPVKCDTPVPSFPP